MKFVFLLVILSSLHSAVLGQCCAAGNPAGGDGSNEGLGKSEFRIYTSFKHSLSKDYYHGETKANVNYIQRSFFDYNNLSLTYGILSRLSLHAEFGCFIDKTQDILMNNENERIRSQGLGDLTFVVRYVAMKKVKPITQLVYSAGMRFPIGAFNEEIDGITIPMSLQPSSGAFKFNAGVFYSRKRTDRKFGWASMAFFEKSQTINKGYLIYRYGNYFQFALAGTYAITKNLNLIANAKFEGRGKDKRENDMKIESSGSRVIFLNPQIVYNLKYKWGLIVMMDFPVYKYVNGYQLTNKYAFQIGIRKNISFCKIMD